VEGGGDIMDNNDDAASSAADQATGVAGKSSGGPASDKYYEKANCDQILLPVFHGDVRRILRVLQEAEQGAARRGGYCDRGARDRMRSANQVRISFPIFHYYLSSYIFADMRYDDTQSTDTTKITKDCTR